MNTRNSCDYVKQYDERNKRNNDILCMSLSATTLRDVRDMREDIRSSDDRVKFLLIRRPRLPYNPNHELLNSDKFNLPDQIPGKTNSARKIYVQGSKNRARFIPLPCIKRRRMRRHSSNSSSSDYQNGPFPRCCLLGVLFVHCGCSCREYPARADE